MYNSHGSFLSLLASVGDSSVLDELVKKHPACSEALVAPGVPLLDCSCPVNYDCVDMLME